MATENVKAVSDPCFALFSKNVIGINISINLIKSLLKLLIPFLKTGYWFSRSYSVCNFSKVCAITSFYNNSFSTSTSNISAHKKQIVSKSVILSISSIDESSVDEDFLLNQIHQLKMIE